MKMISINNKMMIFHSVDKMILNLNLKAKESINKINK